MMHDFSLDTNNRMHRDADIKSKFERNMPPNAMHSSAMTKRIVKYISKHAKERTAQRSEFVNANKLITAVEQGRKVVPKNPCTKIHVLATYGESEFYHYADIVVVVSNEAIVTSLPYDKSKWVAK